MNIFQRIIIQNLVFLLILTSSSAFTLCGVYQSYLQQKQLDHVAQLNRLFEFDKNTPKQLVKNLKTSFDYQWLKVERLSGEVEHMYEANQHDFILSEHLASLMGARIEAQTYANQLADIRISFILSSRAQYQLIDKLIYSLALVFLVLTLINTVISRSVLSRIIVRSVHHIVRSFNRTQGNEPEKISAHLLPNEFKELASKVNDLRSQLKGQIDHWQQSAESYRHEATQDELTGLGNRLSFVEDLENLLSDKQKENFGVLTITRASELQQLNQNRGYEAGDQYVCDVAQNIQRVANNYQNAQLYRINGSDFALLIPNITIREAQNFAQNLFGRFTELQQVLETNSIGYSGIVPYQAGDSMGELLALADTGISIALTKQANGWHIQNDKSILNSVSAKYGNQNWKSVIDEVIEKQQVKLYYQPIQPANKTAKVYSEILARFVNVHGDVLPTASFVAMAEKMDKIIEIDKLVVDATIKTVQNKNLNNQFFAINLTARSAHDEQFCVWLERRLLRDSMISAKLVFEISEFGLQQNIQASQRFITMLHRTGARLTVERFGVGFTSFKFFRDIKPDFIKVDGSYSRNINEDKNNQYFLRVIVDLAHRLGISVLAESVETQEEKYALEQIFVDGTQGYFIGKPSEL
ncbi:EAL domain-containing protein [Catenovulum agarivorans]|uniref:EAL domain-containing protein n=1 Tax=Catenovulum agarivorans TaxID=1172192 RepID=UPI0002EB6933|nr:EAL domain-containing protein [Catenovulum agarivorans]